MPAERATFRDWQTAEWTGVFPEGSLTARSAASCHLPIRHAISHCLSSILASPALISHMVSIKRNATHHHDALGHSIASIRDAERAEKCARSPYFAPLLPQ